MTFAKQVLILYIAVAMFKLNALQLAMLAS